MNNVTIRCIKSDCAMYNLEFENHCDCLIELKVEKCKFYKSQLQLENQLEKLRIRKELKAKQNEIHNMV